MLLAIDIGNTQVTLGVAAGDAWTGPWRLVTDPSRTADEYGVIVRRLLEGAGYSPGDVRRVVAASVVPELWPAVRSLCGALFGLAPLEVRLGVRTGMEIRYHPPTSLGGDRLADAVAARHLLGAPVVAVDCGTATTFNVVDAAGDFVGGAIAPGVAMAAGALARSGALLHRITLATAAEPPLIGRNTEQGMRSGVIHGYAALVTGLLARFDAEMGAEPPVVATGGLAHVLAARVPRIGRVEPNLTLDGLRLIAERNP